MESTNTMRAQLLIAAALMVVGFGFVMQLRTQERLSERLETESEADLVAIIENIDSEIERVNSEVLESRLTLLQYKSSGADSLEALGATRAEIDELRQYVGATGSVGPGVIMEIENKERLLTGFDIRLIIEELRASEAWAIAVNGRRVDQRSAFWRKSGFIYLDGVKLKPDIKIEALGPPQTLFQTISLPSGVMDQLRTIGGVRVSLRRDREIRLEPVKARRPQRYLKRVEKAIKQ